MVDSERLDLSSASSAYRRRRCAGSQNLIRELREAGKLRPPEFDPDAQSGALVHRAWCGERVQLSARELDTLKTLQRLERLVVSDWAGAEEYTLLGREVRLWLHEGFEPVHSGQFDVAYGTLASKGMLIIDGKTLFGEVSPAETNDQLRELVALARVNYPAAESFCVVILQPRVSLKPSIALYDGAEAELALRLLKLTLVDCADPDAPRTPGAWCKHCPAVRYCEEARQLIGHAHTLSKRIQAGEFALPLGEKGARFLDSIYTARDVLEAMRAAYKAILLEQPDAVPGWYMKEGKKIREIKQLGAALELAKDAITLSEFLGATTLNVGALEDALGARLGLIGKRKTDYFNEVFAAVLTVKEYSPELTRVSERKGKPKELKSQ